MQDHNCDNNVYPSSFSCIVESHDGPVTALSCTPDEKYILSGSNYDQKIQLWDLSSSSPCQSGDNSSSSSGNLLLLPTLYLGSSNKTPRPITKHNHKPSFFSLPFIVTQPSLTYQRTTTLWIGNKKSLLGYDVHGSGGGRPTKILNGQLTEITTIAAQSYFRLFTGCRDGMILAWNKN